MKRLAIIGSGDLGHQMAHYAFSDNHYQPVGFFDDFLLVGTVKHGYPILGKLNEINNLYNQGKFDVIMIALGYHQFSLKENIFNKFKNIIPFGNILHSSSFIDYTCKIGNGVFIYPGCILDMNTEVKDNVLLNVGCIIAHDSIIGEHSFLSPSVKVAGFVNIGQKVSLGIGTVVIDNISIANDVRTGGGAVITKNLNDAGLYVGIPAFFKKK